MHFCFKTLVQPLLLVLGALIVWSGLASPALAQAKYPQKNIRMGVPFWQDCQHHLRHNEKHTSQTSLVDSRTDWSDCIQQSHVA
jgi:hypothetical protein